MLVFFHGFDNCVTNVMGEVDTPCSAGGPPRVAMHLVEQLDAARVNALLVAVELGFDAQTGDPGQLAAPGAFRALLHELLTEHLGAVVGCPLDVGSFDPIVVSSHSAGYVATATVLVQGGVPVREVDLLDSLYGQRDVFDGWVQAQSPGFDPDRERGARWVTIYTEGGGTAGDSRAMAAQVQGWLDGVELGAVEVFDDTGEELDPEAYDHPVIFKRTGVEHVDVPRVYFGRLASASGFSRIERGP
jgi:hypothetical protein